jgi:hypothetical protein
MLYTLKLSNSRKTADLPATGYHLIFQIEVLNIYSQKYLLKTQTVPSSFSNLMKGNTLIAYLKELEINIDNCPLFKKRSDPTRTASFFI